MATEKKPNGFQIFLGEMLLPMFLQYGKEGAKTAIQNAIDEDEDQSTAEMIRLANISLYPVVDTVLENYAARTKTKIDDKTVGQMKQLQEELASDGGYDLPDLDKGMPGD